MAAHFAPAELEWSAAHTHTHTCAEAHRHTRSDDVCCTAAAAERFGVEDFWVAAAAAHDAHVLSIFHVIYVGVDAKFATAQPQHDPMCVCVVRVCE